MRSRFRRSDLEGYVEIDHRDSPGFPGVAARTGLPVGPGERLRAACMTCSHCQAQVIKNPRRTRERFICPRCDKYLCDRCATDYHLTLVCYPWIRRMEDILRVSINKGPDSPELAELTRL